MTSALMSIENEKPSSAVETRSEPVTRRMPSSLRALLAAGALPLVFLTWISSWSLTKGYLNNAYRVQFKSVPATQETDNRLPVYVVPSPLSKYTVGEHRHYISDGIEKSPLLRFANNNTEKESVWIVDRLRSEKLGGCQKFILPEVRNASNARKKIYGENATWRIYMMDWSDPGSKHWHCPGVEKFVGEENVFYAKRSIVKNRHFDKKTAAMKLGSIKSFDKQVKHVPYAVRTDFVENIASLLAADFNVTGYPDESWNLADLDRPKDVAHFWPLPRDNATVYKSHAQLRYAVSAAIDQMKHEHKIKGFVGVRGSRGETGRRNVQTSYVRDLIRHKIVVVSQRDNHEDHYRLMEALAGGPLVMTDPMLSLPYGFSEDENIVIYHNMTDLQQKIVYYLRNDTARIEVARKGWSEAMSFHRSWHVVEDLLFGEIQTKGMNPITRSNA